MESYTAALAALNCCTISGGGGNATIPAAAISTACTASTDDDVAALQLPLLTNRALAQHRLGEYAAAAEDAEAALQLSPGSTKAAFRAAAARLALGNGHAADRHAVLVCKHGSGAGTERDSVPAGWAALAQHAAALAAHQQRVETVQQQPHDDPPASVHQRVAALLRSLQAEAEGEEAELPGGPVQLLQQLAGVAGCGTGSGSSSTDSSSSDSSGACDAGTAAAAEAAAALCAVPGQRCWRLLLFFLADPDPACRAAAAAALRAAGQAAAAGSPCVLWPAEVWRRLLAAALAADRQGDCGALSAEAMLLLHWAAERDSWVRQQLLTSPLPPEEAAVGEQGAGGGPPLAQLTALLGDASRLHFVAPATAAAAAQLLRQYAADPAAAQALGSLGCRPLLALLRAAGAAEGMAAFQQPGDGADASNSADPAGVAGPDGTQAAAAGGGGAAATGEGQTGDAELEALQALRKKKRAIYDAELVAVRCALLGALAELAGACRELLLAECVVRGAPAGSGDKRRASAGPFLTGEPPA